MDGPTIKTLAEYIAHLRHNDRDLSQQLPHSDFDTTINQTTETTADEPKTD